MGLFVDGGYFWQQVLNVRTLPVAFVVAAAVVKQDVEVDRDDAEAALLRCPPEIAFYLFQSCVQFFQ